MTAIPNIGESVAVHSHIEYLWIDYQPCSVPCSAYWNDRLGEIDLDQAEQEFQIAHPDAGPFLNHPMWDDDAFDYGFNVAYKLDLEGC